MAITIQEPFPGTTKRLDEVRWSKKDDVLGFVRKALREKEEYNREFEKQAEWNLNWVLGKQDLLWVAPGGPMTRLDNVWNRVRLYYNLLLPYVEILISKLAAIDIELEVAPATEDLKDVQRARTASQVLRYYSEHLQLDAVEEQADRWAAVTGDAYVKVVWDPEAGPELDISKQLGLTHAELEKVTREKLPGRLGDLSVSCLPVFNVFWGPQGIPFEKAEWVIEINERSLGYVADRYHLDPEKIGDTFKDVLLYRASDISSTGRIQKHRPDGGTVLVVELWVPKDTPGCPGGRHVVAVGNTLAVNQPHPYVHGKVPIVPFRHLWMLSQQHGTSYVTSLLGPQSDINRAMSQGVEARQAMASPRIVAPKGSIPNPDMWSGRGGGINEYVGPVAPSLWQGTGMPASWLLGLQKTEKFMQDIIGTHDVSQARVPTGVKSGVAIRALQEADDGRLRWIAKARKRSWEQIGRLMLQTLTEFVEEKRWVRILGEDQRWEIASFVGSDLVGEEAGPGITYYDVRIRTTGTPMSRLSRTEIINSLLQTAFLRPDNPRDRRLVFESLELGWIADNADPDRADRTQARAENERMARGERQEARDFDGHDVHIVEHDIYRKRDTFRELPNETQALFQYHIEGHYEAMAMKALKPQLVLAKVKARLGMTEPAPGGNGQPGAAGPLVNTPPSSPESPTGPRWTQ